MLLSEQDFFVLFGESGRDVLDMLISFERDTINRVLKWPLNQRRVDLLAEAGMLNEATIDAWAMNTIRAQLGGLVN